jgi:hypothetical protein
VIPQILRQFGFQQRVVDVLILGVREHPFRKVYADQPARERRHDYAVQSRSASRVEYPEARSLEARSLEAIILKYCRDQSRRTISQPRQLRFKASREAVKGRFNETVRCAQLCHRTTKQNFRVRWKSGRAMDITSMHRVVALSGHAGLF